MSLKLFFSILAVLFVLAAVPLDSLAQGASPSPTPKTVQSSDDTDGDGVKNSDDRCPADKGTKANKGCPENSGGKTNSDSGKKTNDDTDSLFSNIDIFASPKPSPTPGTKVEEPKKDGFDSLKSNIDIFAAPKANPTAASTSKPDVLLRPDCRYILDNEKCLNILFAMTSKDVLGAFGETKGEKFGMVTKYTYAGMIIDVANTGRVEEVEFKWNEYLKVIDKNPAQDIQWRAGKDKIIKRFGKPQKETKMKGVDGQKLEHLWYDNDHLNFDLEDGKLISIEIKRKISDDEYAQMRKNLQDENDAIEAAKTPEERARDRAKEIQIAFDELHKQLEFRTNEANKQIRAYSTTDLSKRSSQEKSVSLIASDAINLIEDFLKRYKGRLPKAMVEHLSNDIENYRSGNGH